MDVGNQFFSFFAAGVFHDTFRRLSVVPEVLYPSLNVSQFDQNSSSTTDKDESANSFVFLSINRYERKKNLQLALKAFSKLIFLCVRLK